MKGDKQHIFDSWMAKHQGLLFKVVHAYAFTAEDREDLFQEICIQLWHSIPRYKGESAESTWVFRVALYAALAWTRKEKGYRKRNVAMESNQDLLLMVARPVDSRLAWLYEQIARLEPVDRSLMLLQLEGFTYKEMASMLGISESHVGVKINRIKKSLSNTVKEEFNHGL